MSELTDQVKELTRSAKDFDRRLMKLEATIEVLEHGSPIRRRSAKPRRSR